MKTLITLTIATLLASACATPSQIVADAEVKRLCAIDGGIRVYETVKLPAEKFNQWAQVNFRVPRETEAKPSDEYYFEWDIQQYQNGKLEMWRNHFTLYRTADKKILGEAVGYSRSGGDIPGPWHESSYGCPPEADISVLKQRVFKSFDRE